MGTATVNGDLWGTHAKVWSEVQEGQVRPLYVATLDALAVGTGTVLLDAGCGAGMALQLAAERGADVAGIDASVALIEVAGSRVPLAELRVGELEELPYEDNHFDVATAFNSVQYAGDPGRAVAELSRVVQAGGLVAIATWGQPETSEMTDVLQELGPLLPPPPPGAPHGGPFALSPPGRLETFVARAGLEPLRATEVACPMVYPDMATALRGQASAGVVVNAVRHSGQQRVDEALLRSLGKFAQPDGSVRMANTFRFLLARVPTR